jgi:hypothetical protein
MEGGRLLNRYIHQVAGLTGLSLYKLVRQAEDREAWRVIANRHTNGPRRPTTEVVVVQDRIQSSLGQKVGSKEKE